MSSVSDMNISWSTQSTRRTDKSKDRSVFLTNSKHGADYPRLSIRQRPKCVSAKHSGMRFQGWREPKPLRSRCNSAVAIDDQDSKTERLKSENRLIRESTDKKKDMESANRLMKESTDKKKEVAERLLQPTTSSTWKTSSARAREVGTDMNYYSWSRMNVYKDYQKVLYGSNGTVKRTNRTKER